MASGFTDAATKKRRQEPQKAIEFVRQKRIGSGFLADGLYSAMSTISARGRSSGPIHRTRPWLGLAGPLRFLADGEERALARSRNGDRRIVRGLQRAR
jgi:hypothetical protein